jgi:hypothetical protein
MSIDWQYLKLDMKIVVVANVMDEFEDYDIIGFEIRPWESRIAHGLRSSCAVCFKQESALFKLYA